eukprot:UN12840
MWSELSKCESNVFRNTLVMSKSHIIQKFPKMCILTHWELKLLKSINYT